MYMPQPYQMSMMNNNYKYDIPYQYNNYQNNQLQGMNFTPHNIQNSQQYDGFNSPNPNMNDSMIQKPMNNMTASCPPPQMY